MFRRPLMHRLLSLVALSASLSLGPQAHADSPVLVELFTSQGCSSCPPADALLAELAQRDDVMALALHVDYWDYLGWRDVFARPEHAKRQLAYGHRMRERSFTPQIVVAGQRSVIGSHAMDVAEAIMDAPDADLVSAAHGDGHLTLTMAEGTPPLWVDLVSYDAARKVSITRGENAGLTALYANVVTDWQRLAVWKTTDGAQLRVDLPQSGGHQVVIVQEAGLGPIHAVVPLD